MGNVCEKWKSLWLMKRVSGHSFSLKRVSDVKGRGREWNQFLNQWNWLILVYQATFMNSNDDISQRKVHSWSSRSPLVQILFFIIFSRVVWNVKVAQLSHSACDSSALRPNDYQKAINSLCGTVGGKRWIIAWRWTQIDDAFDARFQFQ